MDHLGAEWWSTTLRQTCVANAAWYGLGIGNDQIS